MLWLERACHISNPSPLPKRGHTHRQILSIMIVILMLVPIVSVYFMPLSLDGRWNRDKFRIAWCRSVWCEVGPLMAWCRSGCCDAVPWMFRCSSLDVVMQVLGCFNSGLQMLWCRSSGVLMQVRRCCDTGPRMFWCRSLDVLIQVRGCFDADLRMVRWRSADGVAGPRIVLCKCKVVNILRTEALSGKEGALLGKINVIGWMHRQ